MEDTGRTSARGKLGCSLSGNVEAGVGGRGLQLEKGRVGTEAFCGERGPRLC